MKISINTNLMKLAKLFKKNGAKLYLVGGCVRNAMIGIPSFDTDICSSLAPDIVAAFLDGTDFSYIFKNKELGTMDIIYDGNVWEYTTLRKENYPDGGAHKPESVEFIKSIEVDSQRRDFSVNSIYVDIVKGEIIDPNDGIRDIKKKQLRAVVDPNLVFLHDGLRILRMIRFSSELNFRIEPKTFIGAHTHRANLSDISGERKRNELLELLSCSKKYPTHTKKKAYIHGLNKYNKLGLWKYFNLPIERVRYSLVKRAGVEQRFMALVVDIVSSVAPHDKFAFLTNFLGADGLCFASDEVEDMTNEICGYFEALEKVNNKDYFFKYFNNFAQIYPLIKLKSPNLAKKYNFFYKYLINNKIAIQIKDLDIKGIDIKKKYPNIPQRRYSYILNELLSKVFDGVIKNSKQDLLEEVRNYDY